MIHLHLLLKKLVKAILWMILILVFLFLAIAGLIQIPAIQNKIIHGVTAYVSKKTHTKIEIGKIGISFPKSIVIKGLYLEDLQKDTLVFAETAKVNIIFYDLFSKKITINSFELEESSVKLSNTFADPLLNYSFLLSAFSDSTRKVKTDTLSTSKWAFSLDRVSLQEVRFSYHDAFSGMKVKLYLKHSEITVDKIDPGKSTYQFDGVAIDGLTANILVSKPVHTSDSRSGSILPKISVKNLLLSNCLVSYEDSVGYMAVNADLKACELKDASIDLQQQLINSDYAGLTRGKIGLHTFQPVPIANQRPGVPVSISKNYWKITVNHSSLVDNSVEYKSGDNSKITSAFDPDFIGFKNLNLAAADFFYSSDLAKIVVTKFSATDQNGFAINGFETNFKMDQNSISAQKLKLTTSNSSIDADLCLQFASWETLKDSMLFSKLDLDMRELRVKNSDLTYFKPDLVKQSFFKKGQIITTASGKLSGQIDNLTGENLVIGTGVNTLLKSSFNITGLPDYQNATYHFPNLSITSGRKDLELIADTLIPPQIEIPENLSLHFVFDGKLKAFESTANLTSSFGSVAFDAAVDPNENFNIKASVINLNLGKLLNDTVLYGPVSMTASSDGNGLDFKAIRANIKAEVSAFYLNKYTYHNLNLEGKVAGKEFEGKVNLKDENAEFAFDGLVNLNPNQERYKFRLNVKGADLQKLNLTRNDARISFAASTDLRGSTVNELNGTAAIINIIVASEGKKYLLDSFLAASINEPGKSEINVNSAIVGIKYSGTVSPLALPEIVGQFVNRYFPFSNSNQYLRNRNLAKISFEVQLHNHPILTNVLFPQLKEFEPGTIQGSFDSQKSSFKLDASIKKIVYGTTEINDLAAVLNSDNTRLNYKISCSSIGNSQIKMNNFLFDGILADGKIVSGISSTDDGKNKKLWIRSQLTKDQSSYRLAFTPNELILLNNRWDIAADNYIKFGKQGLLIHHLFINHAESQVNISSADDQFNDDLNIVLKNFKLEDISRIVEKDSSLVKGAVNGSVLLKRVDNQYGIVANAEISNLAVRGTSIGNLTLKAENPSFGKFDFVADLSDPDNNLTMSGFYVPQGGDNSIGIKTAIKSLSLKTIEAFSMGQITEAEGSLSGDIQISGNTISPEIVGELIFDNAFIKPYFLNNRLELRHETIQLKKEGIYFKSFTLSDPGHHTAILDGSVQMKQFSEFVFDLQVTTKDFLLFNTTAKHNKEFFGRMVVDSKIDVSGPMKLPVVKGTVKMKKGSNFTFSVPEDKLTTDRGENVVEFDNSLKFNPILTRNEKKAVQSGGVTGFDLSTIVQIDKEATLRLLMDPASTDSLVVRGEAALSFTMDQSGKMSLTGAYNLNEGSYLVSLQSVIKKKFAIDAGSTIIWNGDPLDAEISIDARYSVRASPYDLVANQSDLSDIDKGGYKQRYPFLVLLKLRGKILHPEISFEIALSPENKGIMGGAVNQKLSMLNDDASALNKQVFALLVLGRFIQENPFQTESSGTSGLIRSTVGKFLSAQLNQLSSKLIPGMELNFDIQSYDDYQTGQAKGRTQVGVGIKKQLFKERLSVQLGGSFDVEGERTKQNSASDITSDVTVEYKLTEDSRFLLKGFRHNQYEGAIEGQLVETGVGVVYVHDFNGWNRLFKSHYNKSDSLKKAKSHVSSNPK